MIASDDESMVEEERIKTIIPFQIAYAVSIHKAQGLEYNSVKVIIPSYNAKKNITFYFLYCNNPCKKETEDILEC